MKPDRVHLIAHANPLGPDVKRFGLKSVNEYVAFCRRHLPRPLRLTCSAKLLSVVEDPWHGGRHDDAARVRDIQGALDDPRTLAIIAAGGGAYFSRILPELDFSGLAKRRNPLWALGFSEMSTLVGCVASYRCGRSLYWLCPNWLAWRLRPPEVARSAFAEFWQILPEILAGRTPTDATHLDFGPIRGELVSGRVKSAPVRLVGGCLSVLAAVVGSPLGRRLKPDGKWLILEDIKESPYRIDRHLAALKLAGWFERAAGLVIGDFHMMHEDTQPAVLDMLKYHLPAKRKVPVVATRSFGHVWPMVPVMLNRPLHMSIRRRDVTIASSSINRA
ncbi:MAG: LD-carboxypeptidase [Phycisphaerae bacterium]|nr:LD-carboxypeptidase [Phycisphaerae bacterium]